ncbi:hypothetical protein ILUMI_01545 [Ignelater luminosus]|uniref:POTRA domain-containing protein n=1 Tax=Ignelater luminosus TaxID=2038154 RepID=A0A8K0DF57_IGNLU|nr:hypothetical protein ILUMI_01545 [Ignelater luminosus]
MGIVHAKESEKFAIPKRELNYNSCDGGETKEIQLEGVQARVDRIHVSGLARTKDDIVEDAVKDLFTASDFQDVLLKAHKVRTKLDSLGCFRNIAVYIDTSKGPHATPNGLEVTFHVKELRRIVGGVNTQVGENEGSLVVGLRAPNLLGRGERLQTEYSYGSKRSNNFNVSFIKPFRGKHNPMFSASVYQSTSEWPVSGYKELDKGLLLDFGFNSFSAVRHNFQWDAAIRDLSVLSRSSSFDVREGAGVHLKSSLKHILSIDLRDDVIFPTCGSLLQITSEFAGAGGNVGFVKNDAFIQTNFSLMDDIVLQASASGGILNSLGNDYLVCLSDVYYLGGPLSLRGFQTRGVGPHSEGNSIGSSWFWSTGLHLYTPLPFRPGRGGFGELFRTHLFVNAGNINPFKIGDERSSFEQITDNIRIAYGIGIAIRLGQMARIEVNYCFPHAYDPQDSPQPGVQFGIGVQFL